MKPGIGTRIALYGLSLLFAWVFTWVVLASKDGQRGWARVESDQVAVVADYLHGTTRVVSEPGVLLFVPWFQQVSLLERAPARLRLRAEGQGEGATDLEPLSVRAADGTTFRFDDLTLVHRIVPAQAEHILADSGVHPSGRSRLLRALVRGVLRDEFGRSAVEEVARVEFLGPARLRARERLNAALAPHGMFVDELPATLPRFDDAYEEQLMRRRVAEQKIELVRAERRRLVSEVDHRLLRVQREKESERAFHAGQLGVQRVEAERAAIATRRRADVDYLKRVEDARVKRLEAESRAASRGARYANETEAFAERVRAVTASGERSVREAWIRSLAEIDGSSSSSRLPGGSSQ